MRLLVDENVPIASAIALRAAGHDVYSASESDAGTVDDVLLARAHAEDRLLIAFDRDFGDLAVRQQHVAVAGSFSCGLCRRALTRSPCCSPSY